jgi:hypothetical protein
MLTLPNNLAPLAQIAEKKEGARWAVTGVRLKALPGGEWEAAATDTKILLQVRGGSALPPDEFPEWPGLTSAANSASVGLIPTDFWAETFAAAKKLTGKKRYLKPPKAVAVKLAPTEATFGFTDTESNKTEVTKLVEGKFPPVEQIWPRKKPKLTVAIDPDLMVQLLRTMSALLPEGQKRVELDFIDDKKPIIARAGSTEMQLKGLIMPLGERGEDDNAPAPAKPVAQLDSPSPEAEQVAELEAEARRMRDEIALLRQERDAARAAVAEANRERDLAIRDARECAAERDAAYSTIRILEANGRQLVDDRDRLQAELHRRASQPRAMALTPTTVPSTPAMPTAVTLSRRERLAAK